MITSGKYFFMIILSAICQTADSQKLPQIKSKLIEELSGLATSATMPGVIYVHNDSGDGSHFFAVNQQGKLLAVCNFKGDIPYKNGVADCEDIACGPGPDKNKSYIYLGDIGDNHAKRPYITVYRFEEPRKLESSMQLDRQVLHLKYPDGPRDAETLMVDPVLKELYIISKRQDSVGIYAAPLGFKNEATVTLQKKGSLYFEGIAPLKWITAGDISGDGSQILVKSYSAVYYWKRNGKEPVEKALQRKFINLPYIVEPQGEAIGFTPDGKGYYCISEGKKPVIYYYTLPARP